MAWDARGEEGAADTALPRAPQTPQTRHVCPSRGARDRPGVSHTAPCSREGRGLPEPGPLQPPQPHYSKGGEKISCKTPGAGTTGAVLQARVSHGQTLWLPGLCTSKRLLLLPPRPPVPPGSQPRCQHKPCRNGKRGSLQGARGPLCWHLKSGSRANLEPPSPSTTPRDPTQPPPPLQPPQHPPALGLPGAANGD